MIGNISKKRVDMEVANSIKETLADTKKVAGNVNLAAEKYPYIGENGNWYVWNAETGVFVDSGTAAQGEKGGQGIQGEQGPQGMQGDKGEKGETGAPGLDGHTPARGVDYWTDNDKAQIVADVLAALPAAEEVAY